MSVLEEFTPTTPENEQGPKEEAYLMELLRLRT